MPYIIEPGSREHDIIKGLLGRGSGTLALAAVAHTAGRRSASGAWAVLGLDIVAAAEQVLAFLEKGPDFQIVQRAVTRAITQESPAAIPPWAKPLYEQPDAFSFLGNTVDDVWALRALGPRRKNPSPRLKGMAIAALAFCRNQDTLTALARQLPEEEERAIRRMARLAQANTNPGEPSAARAKIRRLLKERESGRNR